MNSDDINYITCQKIIKIIGNGVLGWQNASTKMSE